MEQVRSIGKRLRNSANQFFFQSDTEASLRKELLPFVESDQGTTKCVRLMPSSHATASLSVSPAYDWVASLMMDNLGQFSIDSTGAKGHRFETQRVVHEGASYGSTRVLVGYEVGDVLRLGVKVGGAAVKYTAAWRPESEGTLRTTVDTAATLEIEPGHYGTCGVRFDSINGVSVSGTASDVRNGAFVTVEAGQQYRGHVTGLIPVNDHRSIWVAFDGSMDHRSWTGSLAAKFTDVRIMGYPGMFRLGCNTNGDVGAMVGARLEGNQFLGLGVHANSRRPTPRFGLEVQF